MTEQKLGDLLDPALRRLGVQRRVREVRLATALDDVVGPALAPLCRAVSLDRGTLLVATAHGALAHQLHLDGPRLIASLNERIGSDAVRRLRFTALEAPLRREGGRA